MTPLTAESARDLNARLLADIAPDEAAKTLTIRIHRMACPAHDKAVATLLDELTQLEFHHPETDAKMIYTLI